MKFSSEQPAELSRRAHYEDELKKINGTMKSPGPLQENLDSLFLGSTATTFLATEPEYTWKKIRQMLVWDNRTKVSIHRKHGKFRCRQTDLLPERVRSDTLKRMYVTIGLGKKSCPTPGVIQLDVPRLADITTPVTRTKICRDMMKNRELLVQ